MSFKKILLIGYAITVVLGAASTVSAAISGERSASEPSGATLDHGKKWATDAQLRRNMSDLRKIVSIGIDPVKSTQADYRILGDRIQTQVDAIVGQCKLAPEADEVFHTFIAEIIAGALILQGQTTQPPHRGLQTIVRALDRYGIYFDQPGWRTIRREPTSRLLQ
jgi:hypothetical protein